jgi:hypothetical protein
MNRQELITAATAAGIKNASRTKSEELMKALEGTNAKMTKRGRPVNPNSARQNKLSAGGSGRKGRPVVEGSARQLREAAKAARAEANGGVVKRGRPAQPKAEVIQSDQAEA